MKRAQRPYPTSNGSLILLGEYSTGMFGVFHRQPCEILVVGTQRAPHIGCPLQVVNVGVAAQFQRVNRYGISTPPQKLLGHSLVNILIKIKLDFTQSGLTVLV